MVSISDGILKCLDSDFKKMKKASLSHRKAWSPAVGDLVLVSLKAFNLQPSGSRAVSLELEFCGPFRVSALQGPTTLLIDYLGVPKIVAMCLAKPCLIPPNSPPLASSLSNLWRAMAEDAYAGAHLPVAQGWWSAPIAEDLDPAADLVPINPPLVVAIPVPISGEVPSAPLSQVSDGVVNDKGLFGLAKVTAMRTSASGRVMFSGRFFNQPKVEPLAWVDVAGWLPASSEWAVSEAVISFLRTKLKPKQSSEQILKRVDLGTLPGFLEEAAFVKPFATQVAASLRWMRAQTGSAAVDGAVISRWGGALSRAEAVWGPL